jgi:alpha-beta hydrolase superfamily lysophospholipase
MNTPLLWALLLASSAVVLSPVWLFGAPLGRAFFPTIVLFVVVSALWGFLPRARPATVRPQPLSAAPTVESPSRVLFVVVPGMTAWSGEAEHPVASFLRDHGDVLVLNYPNQWWSNADPEVLAENMSTAVAEEYGKARHQGKSIVVVGHSVGALLARRAFLHGRSTWAQHVTRLVLLAGMNRGWDVSGQKPADMTWFRWATFVGGATYGRLVGLGQLILDVEAGAPFVANLRIAWMRAAREGASPEVVQLLGNIDDIVSADDNQDVAVVQAYEDNGRSRFAWLPVDGTGHANIIDVAPQAARSAGSDLREVRRRALTLAATRPFAEVLGRSAKQNVAPDVSVTDVVFILHGIRDLGEWSSLLEHELIEAFQRETGTDATPGRKLAVESARYGYFGMGPFVLHMRREKFVRWFMDSYTETLARYPRQQNVHFFGHSNGTYLLAAGLERYREMRVKHVAFAGSVVPSMYPWPERFARQQVTAVRNYVASDDWVVALFPTFFEQRGIRRLGNNIGSAGFNGFRTGNKLTGDRATPPFAGDARVQNVGYLSGQHGAFMHQFADIAAFLLGPTPPGSSTAGETPRTWRALKLVSDGGLWILWPAMIGLGVVVGARVLVAGQDYGLVLLVAYALLLVAALRQL